MSEDEAPLAGGKKSKVIVKLLPELCLGLILLLHFLFLMSIFAPAIATPDANGYWAQGSLLFTTGRTWLEPESPLQYIESHWHAAESGRYYSQYPPVLSLWVGLVYRLFGFKASVLVNPILATLSLVGFYLLSRRLLGPWWAVAGVLVLAVNPVFNQQAIWCFAHMAVVFCLTWGIFFLIRWSKQGKLWHLFTAGLLFGYIPTIRYPEAIFGLGVTVFLIWSWRAKERVRLHYLTATVGAAIPITALLVRNQLAFGAFYRTAYSLTDEQTAFSLEYFKSHFTRYIAGLYGDGLGLFFILGVLGMAAMCCIPRWRRLGVLLALLTVPLTLLYMANYWSPATEIALMRYLLPTFVCYVLAGLWLSARLNDYMPNLLKFYVIAVVLLQFIWPGFNTLPELQQLHYRKEVLALVTDALEENIEYGDVVIADQEVLQHLDFVRHWRLVDFKYLQPSQQFNQMAQYQRNQSTFMPKPGGKQPLTGEYSKLDVQELEYKIAEDLLAWSGQHRIYYVGSESGLAQIRGKLFTRESFTVIAWIPIPEPVEITEAGTRPQGGMWSFLQGSTRWVIAEWNGKPVQ